MHIGKEGDPYLRTYGPTSFLPTTHSESVEREANARSSAQFMDAPADEGYPWAFWERRRPSYRRSGRLMLSRWFRFLSCLLATLSVSSKIKRLKCAEDSFLNSQAHLFRRLFIASQSLSKPRATCGDESVRSWLALRFRVGKTKSGGRRQFDQTASVICAVRIRAAGRRLRGCYEEHAKSVLHQRSARRD
jgi:hypothetical protein